MVKVNTLLNEEDNKHINTTLSSSGISGLALRDAHYQLGKSLGSFIVLDYPNQIKFTVYVIMRAGLCFALGIADSIERNQKHCKIEFSSDNKDITGELIILVDAVINSGDTIIAISKKCTNKVIIATNVISDHSINKFDEYTVYATRVSRNSFIGSRSKSVKNGKGPDTGDRLFDSEFFL